MTATDDHGTLPAHASALLARLENLRGQFGPARTSHMQHMQAAERTVELADTLRGSWSAAHDTHYTAALAAIRSALEHHLLDRLLFLANRWVETWGGVKEKDWPAEQRRLAALKAGDRPELARWWRDPETGAVNVVVRGLFAAGQRGRGRTLSPYYFRVDQYDPFVNKRTAGRLAHGFGDRALEERRAREASEEWRRYFTFDALRVNLDANRLLVPRLGVQVDVHYGFLSGFVHATQRGYEALHGSNIPSRAGVRDHYAEELVLLYVITIAAAELETFGRMAGRDPRLPLTDWDATEHEVREAGLASEYFWFLSGGPQPYDRIQEVHTRVWRRRKWGRPDVDWRALPDRAVRYYPNPLERLVRLHHTSTEMSTGITFQSPFDRQDARFRT